VVIAFLYTSTVICSSTSAWRGNAETPMAARTWRPCSPKSSTNRSEAAIDDLGRILKTSDGIHVAVDTHNALHQIERTDCDDATQPNCVRAQARAAAYPSSMVRSTPTASHVITPLVFVEITPAEITMLPTVFGRKIVAANGGQLPAEQVPVPWSRASIPFVMGCVAQLQPVCLSVCAKTKTKTTD